ncbi:unnamed protein product [Acanthoscelides obtectus]|uniref:Uncharacterized protein n=1 Tax=Acanthoscelides obtectus TaxID=200917 RepID=A0A9P0M8Y7_ACAOB|nr:unnamed protein product [Acanthoscelides obtectus]CAK1638705.1 hypothetical protein AOBTE_LOCUS10770 [Acanthoscelides obtectus]
MLPPPCICNDRSDHLYKDNIFPKLIFTVEIGYAGLHAQTRISACRNTTGSFPTYSNDIIVDHLIGTLVTMSRGSHKYIVENSHGMRMTYK